MNTLRSAGRKLSHKRPNGARTGGFVNSPGQPTAIRPRPPRARVGHRRSYPLWDALRRRLRAATDYYGGRKCLAIDMGLSFCKLSSYLSGRIIPFAENALKFHKWMEEHEQHEQRRDTK